MKYLIAIAALLVLALPISTKNVIADDSAKTYELQQAYYNQQLDYQKSLELVTQANSLVGKRGGQCVVFVRTFTGVSRDKVQGLAKNTKTNSATPKLGAILSTGESRSGHVAVVIAITDTQVQVVESNYHWNQRISTRWITKNSKVIKGYLVI